MSRQNEGDCFEDRPRMWRLVTFPVIVKYIYHHFLLNEHLCLLSILGQATLYLKLQLILNQSCAVDSRTAILKGRGGKKKKQGSESSNRPQFPADCCRIKTLSHFSSESLCSPAPSSSSSPEKIIQSSPACLRC